jgi:hypothetical protein
VPKYGLVVAFHVPLNQMPGRRATWLPIRSWRNYLVGIAIHSDATN